MGGTQGTQYPYTHWTRYGNAQPPIMGGPQDIREGRRDRLLPGTDVPNDKDAWDVQERTQSIAEQTESRRE